MGLGVNENLVLQSEVERLTAENKVLVLENSILRELSKYNAMLETAAERRKTLVDLLPTIGEWELIR
jgi:regulator of replication initiation timing